MPSSIITGINRQNVTTGGINIDALSTGISHGLSTNFNQASVAGMQLWLKSDTAIYQTTDQSTPVVSNNDPVGRWEDQSGNSNHVTQSVSGSRLTYKTNILNGKPGLLGDGLAKYIQASTNLGLGTSNVTIIAMVSIPTNSQKGTFIKVGDESTGYGVGIGSTQFDNSGNNSIALYESARWINSASAFGTGGFHSTLKINGSGFPTLYTNGTQVYTDTTGAPNSPSASIGIGGYGNRYTDVYIHEILIYNAALTDTNLTLLNNYLRTRYAHY